jgi:hypothetical protein
MEISTMPAWGATTWQRGFWSALVSGGATCGFGLPRLANCRAEAEKPAMAVPGGPGRKERRPMLRVDPIVCGVYCYAESAQVTRGSPLNF